ncbi:MAG: pitrilysin family protein [Pseudomonadota bacterium]
MSAELTTLPNGFRIVSETMPGLASAATGLWINAGGRNERPEQNGIAHFLEHMAFKGTKRRNALQIAEAIENVGGYINAYTSREATAYYARILEADMPLTMDVLADIVRNPVFDPLEIEVERGVILQEIGQVLDTPDDVIFDWLQEAAYPEQPLGRTILGPTERVRAFARRDLSDFVHEHYTPGQLILSSAGAVEHTQLVRLAEDLFGDMPTRATKDIEPAVFLGGEKREIRDLEQAHFAFALHGPGYRDPSVYAAQIYSTALGGGMSSRLFQEVREKRGLCYTIFAQASTYAETGLLTIYAGTGAGQIADLTHLIIDELKRSADDLRSDEVARARAQMKAGLLMGLESPSSRAERMARMVAIWNRVPPIDEVVCHIDAVTTADVKAFAGAMIAKAEAALALYGPEQMAKVPGLEILRERLVA